MLPFESAERAGTEEFNLCWTARFNPTASIRLEAIRRLPHPSPGAAREMMVIAQSDPDRQVRNAAAEAMHAVDQCRSETALAAAR